MSKDLIVRVFSGTKIGSQSTARIFSFLKRALTNVQGNWSRSKDQ